jgi:hypothetical protein
MHAMSPPLRGSTLLNPKLPHPVTTAKLPQSVIPAWTETYPCTVRRMTAFSQHRWMLSLLSALRDHLRGLWVPTG